MTRSHGVVRWFNFASIAFLVLASASGMLLASGVSTTARAIFQVLALGAFLATICSMAMEGNWRMVRTPLWLLPMVLFALVVVQSQSLPAGLVQRVQQTWETDNEAVAFSANRHATFQGLLWLTSACMLLFVALQQLRTVRQLQATIGALAVLLLMSGILAKVQAPRSQPEFLSLMQSVKQNSPAMGRDLTRADSAIGPFAYLPRAELQLPGNSADGNTWYVPAKPADGEFAVAGFWRSSQWSICVLALIPVLVGLGVTRLMHAQDLHGKRWPSQLEGQTGLAFATLAILLSLVAGFHADPVRQLVPAIASLLIGVFLVGSAGRKKFLVIAFLAASSMAAACASQRMRPGTPSLLDAEPWRSTWSDNGSLLRVLGDHLWVGCGLGALGDVWPRYRTVAASQANQASSLLAMFGETGLVGILLILLTTSYVFIRWQRIRVHLSGVSRALTGSMVAGLGALFVAGLIGPGLEAPVTWCVATLLFGTLARGLAGCEFVFQGEARR
ncbi:MAG: hypothetical protein U1D30_24805 [Planctomycetota bacterium]